MIVKIKYYAINELSLKYCILFYMSEIHLLVSWHLLDTDIMRNHVKS